MRSVASITAAFRIRLRRLRRESLEVRAVSLPAPRGARGLEPLTPTVSRKEYRHADRREASEVDQELRPQTDERPRLFPIGRHAGEIRQVDLENEQCGRDGEHAVRIGLESRFVQEERSHGAHS